MAVTQLMHTLILLLLTIRIYKLMTLMLNGILINLKIKLINEWFYLYNMHYEDIPRAERCG